MTELFAADVSKYQVPVTDAYPRQWLIFRIGDGSMDENAKANLAWCRKALAGGRLLGYTGYLVYRPGETPIHLLDELGYPADRHVMLDVESWGGQIGGNRSSELNELAAAIRKRQGGDASRVWGYGNQNDLAHLWPARPAWLRVVVAGYSIRKPGVPNMVGWQYSDGEDRWPVLRGWPRSSKPFGRCDHNRLYLSEEDIDVALTDDDITRLVAAFWGQEAPTVDGKQRYKMWRFITGNNDYAERNAHSNAATEQLAAAMVKRIAALQSAQQTATEAAEKANKALSDAVTALAAEVKALKESGSVTVTPTDVPATLHIGGAA